MKNNLLGLAQSGLEQRLRSPWIPSEIHPRYHDQLLCELELVSSKKMEWHFLAAMELVQHLQSKGFIVGPGVGAPNASLLAYALGIHEVDPIRHGLIFESYLFRPKIPGFQFFLCQDGYVEARNYLCEHFGRDHIAWDGYSEFAALVITPVPVKDVLNISGSRPDFLVVGLLWQQAEIDYLLMTLTPSPLLGRMLRTSNYMIDELFEDPIPFVFDEFNELQGLDYRIEQDTFPKWMPEDGVMLVDCLKKLGPPLDFDALIFAYFVATSVVDPVERENLIGEWQRSCRISPWAPRATIIDEEVHKILACSKGIVIYAEQIIQLLAYYRGKSISETMQWFEPINGKGAYPSDVAPRRRDFVCDAHAQVPDLAHGKEIFEYLLNRAHLFEFRFKSHVIGQALLANGATQKSIYFDMAALT